MIQRTSASTKKQGRISKKPANRLREIDSLPLLSASDLLEIERLFHPERELPAVRKQWVQMAFDLPRVGLYRDQHSWSFFRELDVVVGWCPRCDLLVTSPIPTIMRECRRVGGVRS